ncbi:MAG: DUF503 domain-containing protein [Clostridiales bacterium]|nr:DUF503 domain-containing protein [Clostridiales bacterium]
MVIAVLQLKLHFPWVHSLKEKRMEVKSLSSRARNKFNLSVAEVDEQDIHQIAVLGFASLATDRAQADSIIDNIINFIETNTEGELLAVERDIVDW